MSPDAIMALGVATGITIIVVLVLIHSIIKGVL